ncbi:hypothetical protein ACPPVU_08785 [Mucilaginibacter sp. McL0603]|uniref:hypothetical protein n=1 Tax=Mucilaginibacter sp. McL0603 TaxID=3415670 RepID=UPI003CF47BF2
MTGTKYVIKGANPVSHFKMLLIWGDDGVFLGGPTAVRSRLPIAGGLISLYLYKIRKKEALCGPGMTARLAQPIEVGQA